MLRSTPWLGCLILLLPVTGLAGPYVGASWGKADVPDFGSGRDAWAVHLGYRFGDWLAVEGSYAGFKASRYSCSGVCIPEGQFWLNYTAHDVEVAALGSVPLGRHLALFGKAGLGYLDTRIHTTATATLTGALIPASTISNSKAGVLVGAGVDLRLVRTLNVRMQWSRQQLSGPDVTSTWVGLTYTFGRGR